VFSLLGFALGGVMDQDNGVYDALGVLSAVLVFAALPAWALLAKHK
jgi:hypothetical protein